ncbi:MAG: hypothetical protein K0S42_2378 [Microvirga sp.]|nr:hypothetical protein [Microvirga sp.]
MVADAHRERMAAESPKGACATREDEDPEALRRTIQDVEHALDSIVVAENQRVVEHEHRGFARSSRSSANASRVRTAICSRVPSLSCANVSTA